MKNIAKKLGYAALLAAFLFSSIALVRSNDLYFEIQKQLAIFSDVFKEVSTLYVDDVSPERLMNSGIEAMLNELDPYTEFIAEGEQQEMEILSSGSYGGIGIEVGFRGDDIVIIAPMDGYAADRAGIRSGDVLREINGVSVEGMSSDEVQQLTIGDVGSEVSVTILRPGIDQEMEFLLERERIEVQNISHSDYIGDSENILFLQLGRFGQRSAEEVREKLLEASDRGSLEGLILDLRNNPGGLLSEAVEIIDKFVEPGITVVETQGRIESHNNSYITEEPAIFDELPIIVLMNRGSASASEVVAGAFQDLDRAVVVGESSFGKGLVQTIRPLSYNTSLKLTISKYLTPSGRSIQSIDYANEAGFEGEQIPDSLRRPFTTRNGRTVFDGQGVDPDIVIESPRESLLLAELLQNNHYLFFVNEVLAEKESDEPEMPEDLYDRFLEYLDREDFAYTTRADEYLARLEENLQSFDDEDSSQSSINQLRQSLERKKEAELRDSREQIEKQLRQEWSTQAGDRHQRFSVMIQDDPFILRSLDLLKENETYLSILKP